uniref:Ubiquitin conjugation factor E4 B n=1 Tax=Angiostrongylus cantonensis TaxID=6313 RepID=A0A0K0DET2_ANGCA
MPNSRRKKNSGSNTRVDSSSQKGFATIATVNIAENAEVEQVMLVNGTVSHKPDALVDGCVTHNPILNGSMAASSQTESSDVESISSGSSRRNTMSSSGGDRDTTHSTCKNKVLEEPVRAMLQSCSVASHVDYGSDEGVLRTPEDAYPCCSSSEAMIGGACEGYTPVSGAASQTELASGNGDGLLNVLSMSSWDRVETICELISFLNVYELRLLGACVEGAARPASSTPTMRQHESRSNCPQFISTMATNMGKISYALKVEAAYNVVCLLNSTNRQAAYALVRLIDHLMEIRDMELEVLSTNEARREVLINLGKLAGGFAFVRRFRATQPDLNDIDNFLVERAGAFHALVYTVALQMIWSDGERTFVGRTRNDINTLHHRLLDMFGEERREMKQAQDANIEQPESACSSRTASPTATDSNATPTPAVGTSALRILPYFSMDCSPAAVIQYINALSDLPARMMLSSVIYEQFFASRLSSDELEVAERSIPIASPSLQRYTHPASSPVIYPVASAALAYSSRGTGIQKIPFVLENTNEVNDSVYMEALLDLSDFKLLFYF